ncbi:hypothetical protein BDQ17DRAFT_1428590 [Cyathus striatus]|nr:hypothetical protein BDQ17DRAFT_1428590 [Cyathus striatus]
MQSSYPSTPVTQQQSFGSFPHAHDFIVSNSTFIDSFSGTTRSIEELGKERMKDYTIKGATFKEIKLTPRRRHQLSALEIPSHMQEWFVAPNNSFKTSEFSTTSNVDILSQTGVLFMRYYYDNKSTISGITVAAHILFYEIPFTLGRTRPDVSHHWIVTLAYQLMESIPELETPVLRAFYSAQQYNSENQVQALIIGPLRSLIKEGRLQTRTEIMLIYLDCIDCSMNTPSLAVDIAYLIKELKSIGELRFRFIITGMPHEHVLSTFHNVPIRISNLQQPIRTSLYYDQGIHLPIDVIVFGRVMLTVVPSGIACLAVVYILIARQVRPFEQTWFYLVAFFLLFAVLLWILIPIASLLCYWYVKFTKPWDIHGREEEIEFYAQLGTRQNLDENSDG